ncbi:MAG: aminomethyl transferase family protein [Gammaproteobacteria bacterium]|nr:aminomethyl transferase family protein [Gammaproteobacteria bacterium]
MSANNLEAVLAAAKSPVAMLRNSQIGPYAFPVVKHEFTNWRDEQRSWRETCALFDQSHHMSDLYVRGPDAVKLISDLGINTFKNFKVDKAKQFVACNENGFVIGDAILFFLDENELSLVGRPPAINWVHYHAETGDYDVEVERDERSADNDGQRKVYRFQVQGPKALEVMEKATGGPVPDIRFFNMDRLTIGGCTVRALRHGMVGMPGFELFGAWDERDQVRNAIVEAGKPLGIRQVGARTYPTSTLESGWIPSPLPAIYTGDSTRAYRQWLGADSYEAKASLGGSFESDNIEDYYLTPWDLGYGGFVKFDHDFVGRAALEKIADAPPRTKVTLAWNDEDVTRAMGTLFGPRDEAKKYIDLPLANYATLSFDRIMAGGKRVGLSMYTGYSANERKILSLSVVDNAFAKPGTEVTLVWGESGGGTSKPTVEKHQQTEIRAVVGPAPYADLARTSYRP